ncbi:hypothetical protein [Roseateles amylovorans]|uniref:DUF4375 domain-containing protein n=1 Tax=Roseateles amylovorans TaxID=2978473 RepID=A0ABY6B0Q1_9BURK|nr:hypothetical protein [Roseateles amylovorans]UXH78777.1 hypothetical protein N4261_02215 [Roseateles amylovorans]
MLTPDLADLHHNVERGLYRLLNAPRDIEGGTPVPATSPSRAAAVPALQQVFDAYHEGFQYFVDHSFRWWAGCIAAAESMGLSHEEAVQEAYAQRLAGPASAPEFVWLIRHFWLRVDRVNRELPFDQRVAPQDVLLQWLVEAGEDREVLLITAMPYWPLGLDEQNQWC